MKAYIKSSSYFCPQCGERKVMDYMYVPESSRQYADDDGYEVTEHFGVTKDFSCRNCDCEFTITQEGG